MFKLTIGGLLLCVLVGCQSTAPAKSKCFSNGYESCSFTPIEKLWGTENVDPIP